MCVQGSYQKCKRKSETYQAWFLHGQAETFRNWPEYISISSQSFTQLGYQKIFRGLHSRYRQSFTPLGYQKIFRGLHIDTARVLHYSPLTTHHSLLTTHCSPLTNRHLLIAIHYSSLTNHHSLLSTHYLLLTTH